MVVAFFHRMARPLRHIQPNSTLEITTRTIQGRLLLRPSRELNRIILGIIGRALVLYPGILLHAFVAVSNHIELLLTTCDGETLARFMCFVNSNIAREAGRLSGWREKFWGRRYRDIQILDDEAPAIA